MINSGDFEYWEGRWRDMKVRDFLIEKSEYTVAKNPNDGKWYVLGSTGRGKSGKTYYMPVSTGFKSRGEAEKWAKKQPLADREAKSLMPESELLLEIGDKEYEVARGPVDKLWYVLRRQKGKGKGKGKTHYRPVAAGIKDKKKAIATMKKLMGEGRPDMTTVEVTNLYNDKDKKKILKAAKKYKGVVVSKDPITITFKSDVWADDFWTYMNPRVDSAMRKTYGKVK